MARSSLLPIKDTQVLHDPFGKKGALALFWALSRTGVERGETFSINELAKLLNSSSSTAHRSISALAQDGIFKAEGVRTSKRYSLKKPDALLKLWIKNYKFNRKVKKLQLGISNPAEFQKKKKELLSEYSVPALHTAAKSIFHVGVSNLQQIEAYVPDWNQVERLTKKLGLVEQDQGYEVLLLKPYYDQVVLSFRDHSNDPQWNSAYSILTFLDLYHYPLRGREQAEALFRKQKALSSICSWKEIEALDE